MISRKRKSKKWYANNAPTARNGETWPVRGRKAEGPSSRRSVLSLGCDDPRSCVRTEIPNSSSDATGNGFRRSLIAPRGDSRRSPTAGARFPALPFCFQAVAFLEHLPSRLHSTAVQGPEERTGDRIGRHLAFECPGKGVQSCESLRAKRILHSSPEVQRIDTNSWRETWEEGRLASRPSGGQTTAVGEPLSPGSPQDAAVLEDGRVSAKGSVNGARIPFPSATRGSVHHKTAAVKSGQDIRQLFSRPPARRTRTPTSTSARGRPGRSRRGAVGYRAPQGTRGERSAVLLSNRVGGMSCECQGALRGTGWHPHPDPGAGRGAGRLEQLSA
jgi:hypothetical protein